MRILSAALTCALALAATPAAAKDVVVHMRNQGAAGAMVFEPAFVKAMPGDTIHFVPTDLTHNAETIPTMLPAGVASTKGAINNFSKGLAQQLVGGPGRGSCVGHGMEGGPGGAGHQPPAHQQVA